MTENTNKKIIIHDTQTNEIVERQMTQDELENYEKAKSNYIDSQNEKIAAKTAAEAKLAALGLTADDLKALGIG